MRTELVAEALGDAAQSVLETMFFMVAEGEAEPVFPAETKLIRTSMTFTGWWNGTFEMRTAVNCARTIAESFVGMDEDMSPTGVSDVMCELANMVCGSTLSHLAQDRIFDLSAPSTGPAAECEMTAVRGLMFGDGLITFAMAIEAAA